MKNPLWIKQNSLHYLILVSFLFTAYPATAQTLGTGETFSPPVGRLVVGLVICLIVAYLTFLFMQKLKRTKTNAPFSSLLRVSGLPFEGVIDVVETKRLNSQSYVCLIRYKSKEFLILLSQHPPVILSDEPFDVEDIEKAL